MTPAELKSARHALGLSVRQMAQMLDTDEQTVRRMEMEPDRSTARPVSSAPSTHSRPRPSAGGSRPA